MKSVISKVLIFLGVDNFFQFFSFVLSEVTAVF